MSGKGRQVWSKEQKAAVADELETHITEILKRTAKLNQEAQDKLKLVEELVTRMTWHHGQEDDLPF